MIFDEYFDDIYIINLPNKKDRIERLISELKEKELCENPKICRAIHGNTVTVSSWFGYGGGAWGCMMSHIRLIQDFIMDYNFQEEDQKNFADRKMLILEDDTIFGEDAKERFVKFTNALPEDWGQFYLGGQHTQAPKSFSQEILRASSVNRTHAYAIRGSAAQRIHRHLSYYPDYKGKNHHVDHQYELAHRREDWNTYCPIWWMAGQGENQSDICGKSLPNKWWDFRTEDDLACLPVVLGDKNSNCIEHDKYLAFVDDKHEKIIVPSFGKETQDIIRTLVCAAWDQRKLPFIRCEEITDENMEFLKKMRKGPILRFEEVKSSLKEKSINFQQWKK